MKDWKGLGAKLQDAFADNVYINFVLSPVYFTGLLFLLVDHFGLPFFGHGWTDGALPLAVGSTAFYLYVSKFFQPDLDHHTMRPGMNCFPFFPSWKKMKIFRALEVILNPIRFGGGSFGVTWLWDSFWKGYALLFTHRGLPHWPILGVWLRVGWILLWYYTIQYGLLFVTGSVYPVPYLMDWALSFFPGSPGFGSVGFFLFCFPIYLSDFFHLVGDMTESRLKQKAFFRPQSRGLLHHMSFGLINRLKRILRAARKG